MSFDPDQMAWVRDLQLDDARARDAVVLIKCRRGYAVMALVNTRWNPELRKDEAVLRGFYNPSEPLFPRSPQIIRDGAGLQIDLTAFDPDPYRDELEEQRQTLRASMDARVRSLGTTRRGDKRIVRGLLNHAHARTVSDDGALAASTAYFGTRTINDDQFAESEWFMMLTSNGDLRFRAGREQRTIAWRVAVKQAGRVFSPSDLSAGGRRFDRIEKNGHFLVHSSRPGGDTLGLVRILDVKPTKWLIFEWSPVENGPWLQLYEHA